MHKILISDPDGEWSEKFCNFFEANQSYSAIAAYNGKDAQLKIYNDKSIKTVVLDLDTENHPGLMVLKYIKLTHPSVNVFLTAKSKSLLSVLDLTVSELEQMGAKEVIIKPYAPERIIELIEKSVDTGFGKKITNSKKEIQSEMKINASDDSFTRIKIDDFSHGNVTIFDLFVRIGKNKYIKILHGGEAFEQGRIDKYKEEYKIEYLYFKTSDRMTYIKMMNLISKKLLETKSKLSPNTRLSLIKNATEKYVEEIYFTGLREEVIEEGKKICDNLYESVSNNSELIAMLKSFEEKKYDAYAHSFAVAFFTSALCSQLEWTSKEVIRLASFGALVHDIGKLKIDKSISDSPIDKLNPKQLEEYRRHPELGVEMLRNIKEVTPQILQIVFQHHETMDGMGFPLGLTSMKVFPLAKIVGLCDFFVHIISDRGVTPYEAIKIMLKTPNISHRYDANLIKKFISSFIKSEK